MDGDFVVSGAPRSIETPDRPSKAAEKFADAIAARARPLTDALRRDTRLRGTGLAVGLASVAVGALSGRPSLTIAGAQALHFGLQKPLMGLQRRSGLSVEPSVGPHHFVITVQRIFD
jgi:hypothetical protein